MKRFLVTGGGGFVGGNFVRLLLTEHPDCGVTVFDSLGGRETAPVIEGLQKLYGDRFEVVRGRVTSESDLESLFSGNRFDFVVHFAAKNPSGASISNPASFVETNVVGTAMLLEAARKSWSDGRGTFLHLSSYEVYGSSTTGVFTEDSPLNPSTPYAASKASADQLTLAYHRTFGMRTLVTRTTNIYGPWQSGDKLIPSIIEAVRTGGAIPVYGDGANRRDWIHVDDHNRGVFRVLEEGEAGMVYHLGAHCELSNIELVRKVARLTAGKLGKSAENTEGLITFVKDREGHDSRRSLDTARAGKLGFEASIDMDEGLEKTVNWCLFSER